MASARYSLAFSNNTMPDSRIEFFQQSIDENLLEDLRQLLRLAVREDLDRSFDITTVAVIPPDLQGTASIVARQPGIAAGIDLLPHIIEELEADLEATLLVEDGKEFAADASLATLTGDARDLLTCERIILNFLGKLCGVASMTRERIGLISGTQAKLYDTRKTTPGFRRLEKYAVRCGGGTNHRGGLYEAVMIKDNHLACRAELADSPASPAEAVKIVRDFIADQPQVSRLTIVEVEVDSLEQLQAVLAADPDIVLLDNMSTEELRQAVELRDKLNPPVQLEASGGIRIDTLRAVAETGVDRISMGALTHSAINLDLGLDWQWQRD